MNNVLESEKSTKQAKLPVRVPQGGHVKTDPTTCIYTIYNADNGVDLKFQAITNNDFITILEC